MIDLVADKRNEIVAVCQRFAVQSERVARALRRQLPLGAVVHPALGGDRDRRPAAQPGARVEHPRRPGRQAREPTDPVAGGAAPRPRRPEPHQEAAEHDQMVPLLP